MPERDQRACCDLVIPKSGRRCMLPPGHEGECQDWQDVYRAEMKMMSGYVRDAERIAGESTQTIASLEAQSARLERAILGVALRTCSDGPCWCPIALSRHTVMCEAARAAIAKARGES